MRSTTVAVARAGFDGVLAQQQTGLEEDGRVKVQQWQGTDGMTSGLCFFTVLAAPWERPPQVILFRFLECSGGVRAGAAMPATVSVMLQW